MNKKSFLVTVSGTALFLSAALPVYAIPVPEFGSCLNPQWSKTQENTLKDPNGARHGVIGVGSYLGTDTIYSSNGNVMQCLCSVDGNGYQTNWLKAANLSQDQIDELKTKGWKYVPYGQDWGLHDSAYLAKNIEYTCAACTPTPTPSVEVTPTVTPTPTVTTTPGPTATPTPAPKVGGASATNTLATTGNSLVIYLALLAGLASLVIGMVIKKFSK